VGILKRIRDLEETVENIERRLNQVELSIQSQLSEFGDYKNKSEEELLSVKGQLQGIIGTLESLVSAAENEEESKSARDLLKRARNHLTRAKNAAA